MPQQMIRTKGKGSKKKAVELTPAIITRPHRCPYCAFAGADLPWHVKKMHGNDQYWAWIRNAQQASAVTSRARSTIEAALGGVSKRAPSVVCRICRRKVNDLKAHFLRKHTGEPITTSTLAANKPAALTLPTGTIEGTKGSSHRPKKKKHRRGNKANTSKKAGQVSLVILSSGFETNRSKH